MYYSLFYSIKNMWIVITIVGTYLYPTIILQWSIFLIIYKFILQLGIFIKKYKFKCSNIKISVYHTQNSILFISSSYVWEIH